jgi:uncharacterized protein
VRILISGASGMLGSALIPLLKARGHTITRLVRSRQQSGEEAVYWNPATQEIDAARLEGFDAVIHLAGENIGTHRWTDERKRAIYDSRVVGTRLLATTLAACAKQPRVLISMSATGYYGDRGEDLLTESEPPGVGFMSHVVRDWEEAAEPAVAAGIRVVQPRLGVVLAERGGALERLILPFRFGVGGPLAGGTAWFPWIALEDTLSALLHLLQCQAISGPVNVVAPEAVRQRDLAHLLGRVLNRPAWLNVPRFALDLRLGHEFAGLLLESQRVLSQKLIASAFHFQFPGLETALRGVLAKQ